MPFKNTFLSGFQLARAPSFLILCFYFIRISVVWKNTAAWNGLNTDSVKFLRGERLHENPSCLSAVS